MAVTAKDIEWALFDKYLYQQAGWVALREVSIDDLAAMGGRVLTRRGRRRVAGPTVRRIDMLLISTAKGRNVKVPYERIGLEIKVSRADFLREVRDAGKRQAWHQMVHRFAYVAPKGMIRKDEIPEGCGLLEYDPGALFGHQHLTWAKVAPRRSTLPDSFDDRFVVYLAGRASRAEAANRSTQRLKEYA